MLLRTSSNPMSPALLATIESPAKRDLLANAATIAAYSTTTSPSATSSRRQIVCSKSPKNRPKFNKNNDFRRALSDSNLEDLAYPRGISSNLSSSCSSFSPQLPKLQEGPKNGKKLESAPSFGIYHSGDGFDLGELEKEIDKLETGLDEMGPEGEMIESGEGEFSFGKANMGLIAEEEGEGENEDEGFGSRASPPMYLAAGLGVGFIGGNFEMSFEEGEDGDAFYRNMLEEYPNHPLLLRNYAERLKDKGNLEEASEYYYRATIADPYNSEVLAQYAKLVWEVHRDEKKAGEYFERAVQVSSQDCHVLAAWASFLWETASDSWDSQSFVQPVQSSNEGNLGTSKKEEHLKQLVQQNPLNAMFLSNYAEFLYKKKGDLKGAEEYYTRAILVDPRDGEILSQYANLVWEAQRDEVKARAYFERAAQAAPDDSHVLASYASFLWATEEDEKDETINVPSVHDPSRLPPRVPALRG